MNRDLSDVVATYQVDFSTVEHGLFTYNKLEARNNHTRSIKSEVHNFEQL